MCSISGLVSTTLAFLRAHARSSAGGVAVVGDRAQARARATSAASGAGPGRAPWWGRCSSAVSRLSSTTDDDDRHLVAERLSRRGAGRDDDAAPVAQRVDRRRPGARRGRSIPRAASRACDLAVQRLREAPRSGPGARAAPRGARTARRARDRPRARRAHARRDPSTQSSGTDPPAPPTELRLRSTRRPSGLGECGQWRLRRRRRRGSRRTAPAAPPPSPRQPPPVYGIVMFWIWSGFERERDPAELVQVLDADAVELGVAAEQREQLELARRALHLRPELAHRVEDQQALVVRADDVARREVVAVARERQRLQCRSCAACPG